MNDAAKHLIDIQKASRDLEALLAFASPTPKVEKEIAMTTVDIAYSAMMIFEQYRADTKPPLKKAPDVCGCD